MLKIKRIISSHPLSPNCYIICSGNECAIIDPTIPFDESIVCGELKYIILTHAHFDHIWNIDEWVNNTGAKVIAGKLEVDSLKDPMKNCYKLYNGSDKGYYGEAEGVGNGDNLPLGDTTISVIECPGHTIGSVTYLCESHAFVGDTIFAGGGYGRFDLPTGNMTLLFDSIQKLAALPEDTTVYPGHGETTTIKQYRKDTNR
jgi:glyoxylase-like metal-dependent hydrolase (beta-lactamase superfamily II)